jgi:hypothetical protein
VAGSVLNFGKLVSMSISVNSLGRLAFDLSKVGISTFRPSRSSRETSSRESFNCPWVVVLLVKLTAQPRHEVLVLEDCGTVGSRCTVLPLKALMRRMLLSVQDTASILPSKRSICPVYSAKSKVLHRLVSTSTTQCQSHYPRTRLRRLSGRLDGICEGFGSLWLEPRGP